MSPSTKRLRWLVGLCLILAFHGSDLLADEPEINQRFPIHDSSNLSRPIVQPHIHECARAVWVYGFVPKATIEVFARHPVTGVNELVGHDNPVVSFGKITLQRPLILGESITATQTVLGITSDPTLDPVVVEPYPALTRPVVGPDIYDCGQVVPVRNLISSTHVEVSDLDAVPPLPPLLGTGENAGDWDPVITRQLVKGHRVQAVQIACPDDPAKRISSPLSVPVTVKLEPSPLPAPAADKPIPGTDVVTLHNLLVGAAIVIRDKATGSGLGSGLATAADNYAHLLQKVTGPILVTQALCSTSPVVEVETTNELKRPIVGAPICEGSQIVTVDNTDVRALVVVLRNGDWTHPVYSGGAQGTLTISLGGSITLHAHDKITAVQYVGSIISPSLNEVEVGCDGGANVVTQHNDNARTGAYLAETILTPARVRARGMVIKYTKPVSGAIIAQPLYVRRVAFERGAANGLFLATLTSTVYGLDADTGAEKWKVVLADSDPRTRGVTAGIHATPVIDMAGGRMYVMFMTRSDDLDAGGQSREMAYWLVALDYRTGAEQARTMVSASVFDADGKTVNFDARNQNHHAALLLDHGSVYVAFCSKAGVEGSTDFHGWVMRYRSTDLAFQGVFCASKANPMGKGAGIWQGGGGLTTDPDGNIYFLAGNGQADLMHEKYGDCFLKLAPTPGGLIPTAFVPDHSQEMEDNDADFGSGGALTIPGTNLVIGGGKPGLMYLLKRSTMISAQTLTATTNQYEPWRRWDAWDSGPHLHGSPTYWRGPDNTFGNLYVWGEKDFLRLYRFNTATGLFQSSAFRQGSVKALRTTMPGGIVSLSANGNTAGTGIVWATLPASNDKTGLADWPGHLYAFDAETLTPLWDTGFKSLGHWVPPTIADHTVFIGSFSDELIAYTLGPEDGSARGSRKPFQPHATSFRGPLSKRYPDEASVLGLPRIARMLTAPPNGLTQAAVLKGNGKRIYEARMSEDGSLAWESSGSTAVLHLIRSEEERERIQVRLSAENVWSASDGSSASGVLEKSAKAPETADASWLLYRLTATSGKGLFRDAGYIQCVETQGGAPPRKKPTRRGETVRSPFHARYIVYRRP
jgi:hypothetical protein